MFVPFLKDFVRLNWRCGWRDWAAARRQRHHKSSIQHPTEGHTMKRRTFLKTAGALSSHLLSGLPSPTLATDEAHGSGAMADSWEIASDRQRIVVTSAQNAVTYQSFVRDDKGGWSAGSIPSNQIVSGPSFHPELGRGRTVKSGSDTAIELTGAGHAKAKEGSPLEYTWNTTITRRAGSPWFRFETKLRLPRDMRLQQGEVAASRKSFSGSAPCQR